MQIKFQVGNMNHTYKKALVMLFSSKSKEIFLIFVFGNSEGNEESVSANRLSLMLG